MRPALIARVAAPAVRRVALRPSVALALPASSSSTLPRRAFSSTPAVLKKGGKEKGKAPKSTKQKGKEAEEEEGLSEEEINSVVEKTTTRINKSVEWAKGVAFEGVERGRGRVSPALLDSVKVITPEGSVSLKSIASITIKNHALHVEAWDPELFKPVEMAVNKANIPGLSPQREGNALHIPVSKPTSDMRKQIMKSIHDTVEAAKGQIRQARTDGMKSLGGRGEEGTEQVQDATDKATAEFEKLLAAAKKELDK